ncbi:unnamed protein product [Symbiodinium sp. CCMP2592]|nr:unnamed protein product [Symbiodinium sp. CCMP2592]
MASQQQQQETVAKRRNPQDYRRFIRYMPASLWRYLQEAQFLVDSVEKLGTFLFGLGLRLPSELTVAYLTAAVTFRNGDSSSFQLHQNFLTVKRLWKQLYSRLSKLPSEGLEPWLQELPGNMDELPKPYVPAEPPLPEAEWPVPQRRLDELAARVPLRKTNRVVAEQTAQSSQALASGAQPSGHQLAAVVQAAVTPLVSMMMQGGRQTAAADTGIGLPGLQILSPGRRFRGKRSLELQTPPREAASASTVQAQQLALPPPPAATQQPQQVSLVTPPAGEEQPPSSACLDLQSPPPKACTLRDNALELASAFKQSQDNQKPQKGKRFARPAAQTKVFARPAAATKPKVVRQSQHKKPAACKKPAAAGKQALSQTFACVVSRAYHGARNRALAAGQSKESAAEAGRRAYRKAKAEFAA